MNIIVPSNKNIKITDNLATDINQAKLFIANELVENNPAVSLKLNTTFVAHNDDEDTYDLNTVVSYSVTATPAPIFDKQNYKGFILSSQISIPNVAQGYSAVLIIEKDDIKDSIKIESPLYINNLLEDQHNYVVINDRNISPINTTIIAGDRNSQQITFQIKERYDGVSFLDDSKKIYVDYIPLDESLLPTDEETGNKLAGFLSDEIEEKIPVTLDNEKWIYLKWNIPPQITVVPNSTQDNVIRFAISIINNSSDYIWQTQPSSFTISKNLGLRPILPITPSDESTWLTQLITDVECLKVSDQQQAEQIENLSSLVGNQDDNDDTNDESMILDAGGAPTYEYSS